MTNPLLEKEVEALFEKVRIETSSPENFTVAREAFTQALERVQKESIKACKGYWYHAGKWHKSECVFLLTDEGVCNCKNLSPNQTQP